MEDVNKVKELGEQIGYGHLMSLASALWRKSLKEKGFPVDGAFVATCLPFLDKEIADLTKGERENYDKMVDDVSRCECGEELYREETKNELDGMYYCECGNMH